MYKFFEIDMGDRPVRVYGQDGLSLKTGDACIVQMAGWLDFGHVLAVSEPVGKDQQPPRKTPGVVRRATYQDQSAAGENNLFSRTAQRKCQEYLNEHKLDIRLIKVRFSFDRSRLFILYSSNERVDLKDMVDYLAKDVSAKIEMRHLGVRDAAQMVGGMAPCGRQLCCSQWLKSFENVYIKMAKNQGLSLNPSNINGMCGRLKCCLRFEDNCYLDLAGRMPREGARVNTPHGAGIVVARNILKQKLKVRLEDKRILEFDASQTTLLKEGGKRRSSGQASKTGSRPGE